MPTRWSRILGLFRVCCTVILLGASITDRGVSGADVRLRNDTPLSGNLLVMNTLGGRAVGLSELKQHKEEDPTPHNIARIDNGWQRIYFPLHQIKVPDNKQDPATSTALTRDTFIIKQLKQPKTLTVASFGSITFVDPFDEYGHRWLTIETQSKTLKVYQGITEVAPDHVMVDSQNCHWKLGLPLKTIPIETLDKLLKKQLKRDDATGRFALVRFYMRAEYYREAFVELAALAQDFPDKKETVQKFQTDLMNFFGKEILLRLERRRRAGQHQLAESMSKNLVSQELSGSVQQDVQLYIKSYEQAHQNIERAKLLLSDWQAKLTNSALVERLQPLRSAVNEQLDYETLPRLDAFLKAEADSQYEPAQRLGLAYSAWVLGPANAIPDLDQALRAWEARNWVLEYLRSDDPSVQAEMVKKLESAESISPKTVLNLVAQLPPILDGSDVEPGTVQEVGASADGQVSYSVSLPAEYSIHHSYPLLIALRPRTRTAEQTATIWAGDQNSPDFGNQRGYIVISPDYAEKNAAEYTYGAPAHKYVLDCLIDARKRFAVDSDRVFLAGHGMGADAAFDIGMSHPDEFAGVLPLGGNAINYCNFTWENSLLTSWYVVGKGYDTDGNRDNTSNPVFDKIMRKGIKADFMLVEYLGRNGENVFDDIPKLYDWMDRHQRQAMPKEIDYRTLRKTDNRIFWVTALGLPRDVILPAPIGAAQKVSPMDVEVHVATPGNIIRLNRATEKYTLRLTPDQIDFDREVIVKVGDRKEFKDLIKPDSKVMLEELQLRGDRKRLPLAVISP